MNTIDQSNRFANTIRKLDSFREFKDGWDLGRGEKIFESSIDSAKKIAEFAYEIGIWKSSAFPTPSGSVLLAFPISAELDIEVYAETDGTFSFSCERSGVDDIHYPDCTFKDACLLLRLFGQNTIGSTWSFESSITNSFTITNSSAFEVQRFAHPPTEGFQRSIMSAPRKNPGVCANTSINFIKEYREPPYITGISIPSRATQKSSSRAENTIHAM